MKTGITGTILFMVIILSAFINLSITTENVRLEEIEQALANAQRQTIENTKIKEMYQINSEEELMAEFNRNLLTQISSDSDITVRVLDADYEEGMLDVEVIAKFKYPTGKDGKVSVRKTIIYDAAQIEGA